MAIEEVRTLNDTATAIIKRAKLEDKDSVRVDLFEKINTAYQKVGFEKFYRWSGATYPLKLRAKYTTGTIAVTQGLDTITGTGTAWTRFDHERSKIQIPGSNVPFTILRVDESTQVITLSAPFYGTTTSGITYAIFRDEYGLYPDLQGIRKLWIPGLAKSLQPTPCGPEEIDQFRGMSPFRGGTPHRYSMFGLNIYSEKTWATFNMNTDFWEDDYNAHPRNQNLVIWPGILTADMTAFIRYSMVVPPMSDPDDEPLMYYATRARLVYEVLEDNFITNRDPQTMGMWRAKNKEIKSLMTAEIETTDDEFQFFVDHRSFSRKPSRIQDWDFESR